MRPFLKRSILPWSGASSSMPGLATIVPDLSSAFLIGPSSQNPETTTLIVRLAYASMTLRLRGAQAPRGARRLGRGAGPPATQSLAEGVHVQKGVRPA